ncbi:MAG: Rossmann-like and DUF2520 domain-containing protein [Candidatus Aminicenantes bacterium]
MREVSIIGAGRLGASLGYALSQKGYRIKALSCTSLSSARQSRKIIGEGKPLTDNLESARRGQIVIISVPDKTLEGVVGELALSDIQWSNKYVFHCSGLLGSDILESLKDKGAATASLHPAQSFARKEPDMKLFEGIYFGLEGDQQALDLGKKIVHRLGGHFIILPAQDKLLYHAACSLASNSMVVLLDMAVLLLEKMNIEREEASKIILPLVQRTLHNVKSFNTGGALTGPVIRGDYETVNRHVESLRELPGYRDIYSKLALKALEIAEREKKLSAQKIKALRNLLEET